MGIDLGHFLVIAILKYLPNLYISVREIFGIFNLDKDLNVVFILNFLFLTLNSKNCSE